MPESNVSPWGKGEAKYDPVTETISSTFALSSEMSKLGFIMKSAVVDETGYFLNVTWKRVE